MSVAVVLSRGLAGLDAPLVTVEVHLAGGLPAFNLVGLPDTEVKESRDRVRAALQNAQFEFPARKITVNLAPADLPKESGRFDLPIALGVLAATGQIPAAVLAQYEFAGELALTGALRPIRGALPMTLCAHRDGRAFVLPAASAREASLVRDAVVYPADGLLAVCAHLAGRAPLEPAAPGIPTPPDGTGRRSRRRARAGRGEASAHHRRCRRPQPADDRAARNGQVDAGAAASRNSSAADRGRGARDRGDRLARGSVLRNDVGDAALPGAAPHGERGRAGRRRVGSAARRDLARAPRRALPRRVARVGSPRARRAARAARIGRRAHLARGAAEHVPRAIPVRRRDESVPVRMARAFEWTLSLHAGSDRPLSRPHIRAAARPHRSRHRGAGGRCGGAVPGRLPAGRQRRVGIERPGRAKRRPERARARPAARGNPTRG